LGEKLARMRKDQPIARFPVSRQIRPGPQGRRIPSCRRSNPSSRNLLRDELLDGLHPVSVSLTVLEYVFAAEF
jgi:hypothetical protein